MEVFIFTDLRGKAFTLASLSIMLALGFLYISLYEIQKISLIPIILNIFIMSERWNLSNTFSVSYIVFWTWKLFSNLIIVCFHISLCLSLCFSKRVHLKFGGNVENSEKKNYNGREVRTWDCYKARILFLVLYTSWWMWSYSLWISVS